MNEKLLETVQRFEGKKILVVGDVMLDEYIEGEVERISPEAPIPVVNGSRKEFRLGGAANTAENVSALGGNVFLLGAVGKDELGKKLKELIAKKGISTEGLLGEEKRITTHKTRVIARSQQVLRIDFESTHSIGSSLEETASGYIREKLPEIDAVIVSDYGKGFVSKNIVKGLMQESERQGKPVAADSRDFFGLDFRGAAVLKQNKKELQKETGIRLIGEKDFEKAAEIFMEKLSPKGLLVTLGKDGMVLFKGSTAVRIASRAEEVFDVSGAGDTVSAVLGLGLAAGADLSDSAHIANAAAGIVVGKLGTSSVRKEELLKALGN